MRNVEHRQLLTQGYGVISQKVDPFTTTAVRTSDPTNDTTFISSSIKIGQFLLIKKAELYA
jgi:hypothetical protein